MSFANILPSHDQFQLKIFGCQLKFCTMAENMVLLKFFQAMKKKPDLIIQ